jgi:hypothetical protein
MLNLRESKTSETQKIITAKLCAARRALSPEERSEIVRRGHASMSPEAKEKRNRLISEAAKKRKSRPPKTIEDIAKMTSAGLLHRRAKAAAKIAKGLAECPHCKCAVPLECFYRNNTKTSLPGSRDWSACKLCYSILKSYGRYPFISKRTGKLRLPVDFHGFKKRRSKAIYEQHWVPKLDTGELE